MLEKFLKVDFEISSRKFISCFEIEGDVDFPQFDKDKNDKADIDGIYTYEDACAAWIIRHNCLLVQFLIKFITNLCIGSGGLGGGSDEILIYFKNHIRILLNNQDTSVVFNTMIEQDKVLSFYFNVLMQSTT